jgi:hypothetical protein
MVSEVTLKMSSPQETPLGKALFKLYYMTGKDLLDMIDHVGYPHNGGEHTLRLTGPLEEIKAWVGLFQEMYGSFPGLASAVHRLESRGCRSANVTEFS